MRKKNLFPVPTGFNHPNNNKVNDVNPFKTEAAIYRNQSIDLSPKSVDRFLYDIGLRLETVNQKTKIFPST